jgi:predicted dehydrogenase
MWTRRSAFEARNRTGVKMQEAFMVRTHPQWLAAAEMIQLAESARLPGNGYSATQ